MEVRLDATVGKWSEDQGRASVAVETENSWPEALPWKELCAELVLQAIRDYKQKQAQAQDA